jgi:hypothetical protein
MLLKIGKMTLRCPKKTTDDENTGESSFPGGEYTHEYTGESQLPCDKYTRKSTS